MQISDVRQAVVTPAFIFDEAKAQHFLELLIRMKKYSNYKILFPLKSFSLLHGLMSISEYVDGYAVSSINEAKLVRQFIDAKKIIQLTAPILKPEYIPDVRDTCDAIIYNSLTQFAQFLHKIDGDCRQALRVRTGLSFVKDERYNPCRKYSKLGVDLGKLNARWNNGDEQFEAIDGILFHTNCESEDFSELLETALHLDREIPWLLDRISWINVGGGYLFDETSNWIPFHDTIRLFNDKYGLDVYFEPGKGVIGEAGQIISEVVDIFENEGKTLAILDTTVNHIPEVFEYQYRPMVAEESPGGEYSYIFAGASCLAGDLFGEYSFNEPLKIGSRVTFEDVGSYTLVKAHMFNGINLPTIYVKKTNGELELVRKPSYLDFLTKCGVDQHASIRESTLDSQKQ